jgi:hypothetical protein
MLFVADRDAYDGANSLIEMFGEEALSEAAARALSRAEGRKTPAGGRFAASRGASALAEAGRAR